jgi:hypothetical protein
VCTRASVCVPVLVQYGVCVAPCDGGGLGRFGNSPKRGGACKGREIAAPWRRGVPRTKEEGDGDGRAGKPNDDAQGVSVVDSLPDLSTWADGRDVVTGDNDRTERW